MCVFLVCLFVCSISGSGEPLNNLKKKRSKANKIVKKVIKVTRKLSYQDFLGRDMSNHLKTLATEVEIE